MDVKHYLVDRPSKAQAWRKFIRSDQCDRQDFNHIYPDVRLGLSLTSRRRLCTDMAYRLFMDQKFSALGTFLVLQACLTLFVCRIIFQALWLPVEVITSKSADQSTRRPIVWTRSWSIGGAWLICQNPGGGGMFLDFRV